MPLPLPKSAFAAARAMKRPNNVAEDVVLGVTSGGGAFVQGVTGLAAEAAKYSQKEASQLKDKSVSYVKPPSFFRDIPRAVWETLNTSPAQSEKRLVETSRNLHRSLAKPMAKVREVADREHSDAKQTTDEINSNLGKTGKVVSAVTEAGPSMINPAAAIALGVGKERSLKGGIIPAAASIATKGLAPAANRLFGNTVAATAQNLGSFPAQMLSNSKNVLAKTVPQVGDYVAGKLRENSINEKVKPKSKNSSLLAEMRRKNFEKPE